MGRRRRRAFWFGIPAIGIAGLLLLVALLHAGPVRARVLQAVLARLHEAGVDARADGLDYNLLTLEFRVRGAVVARPGGLDAPFFRADEVVVDLPWSILRGGLAFERVALTRPRLILVSNPDGSTNLPISARGPSSSRPPVPVRVGHLEVRDLAVHWSDGALGSTLDLQGLSLALTPQGDLSSGRLRLSGSGSFARGARQTTVTAIDGTVRLDGSGVSVAGLRVDTPEARVTVDGTVGPLFGAPQIALRYRASLNLARLAPWAGLASPVAGSLLCTGLLRGAVAEPTGGMEISGQDLSWGDLRGATIAGELELTNAAAELRSLAVNAAGGELSVSGTLSRTATKPSRVAAAWHDLDAGTLLGAFAPNAPMAPAGRVGGRLEAEWERFAFSGLLVTAENRSSPGTGDSTRALEGRVALSGRRGHWTLTADQRVGAARVRGSAVAAGTGTDWRAAKLVGNVRLEADDLAGVWQMLAGVLPASAGRGAPAGEMHADLTLGGSLGTPRFTAAVDGSSLRLGAWGPARLTGRVSGTPTEVNVDAADVVLGANRGRARGRVALPSGRVIADMEAALPDLAAFAAILPSGVRPEGHLRVTAVARGTWPALDVRGSVSGSDLRVAGQVVDRLTGDLRLERGVLVAGRLELAQRAGNLVATGRYDTRRGTYSVEARGRGLTIASIPGLGSAGSAARVIVPGAAAVSTAPLAEAVDLDFSGSGSSRRPEGSGRVVLNGLAWEGRAVGRAEVGIELADRELRVDATAPDVGLRATGRLALSSPGRFHLEAAIAHDVAALATRLIGNPRAALSGTIEAGLGADGTIDDPVASTVTLELRRLDAALNGSLLELRAPAVLRYSSGHFEADPIDLQLGQTHLTLEARRRADGSDAFSASLNGRLEDLAAIESLLPRTISAPLGEARPAGAVALTATAVGTLARPSLEATLGIDVAHANLPGLRPLTGASLRAAYRDGILTVERLGGTWQEATFDLSGRLPARLLAAWLPREYVESLPAEPRTARASARVSGISPGMLSPFVAEPTLAGLKGTLAADLSLEADRLALDGVRGTATLFSSDTAIAGVPLSQRAPARLVIGGGRVELADWAWAGGGTRVALAGDVRLAPEPALNLSADGQLDLRLLNAFVPDIGASGRARLTLQARGAPAAPALEGGLEFEAGELRLTTPRLSVTGITGRVNLTPDSITLADLAATANGGEVRVSGEVRYHGIRPTGGRVSMTGRGLGVELAGVVGEVDASLDLAIAPERVALTGVLVAVRSGYRQPLTLAAALLAPGRQGSTAAGAATPSWLDRTSLDIRATTADDLMVDNNYARVDVGADLRLVGTLAHPSIVGRATVREGGRIYLGGNVYRLAEAGSIDFANRERVDPRLNIAAVTRVQAYDITLAVKGTADALETELRSDPPLGKADLVSLLLTGRPASEARGLPPSAAGQELLGLLSGEFLGAAGRAVGLDALRIQRGLSDVQFGAGLIASEADPGARLTFAKNIGPSLEVVFSQALSESGKQTWILSYRPRRNLEIRGVSSDEGDRSYELRHDLSFGGAARPSSGPPRPGARVAAVVFQGRPRFGEAELGRQIKLSAGDRFDLRRWQDDRDRLETFYHRSGYLEARITASRKDSPPRPEEAPAVTLQYEIRAGPETVLDVEGFALPASVTSAMRAAWTRAVVDDFLVADLEALARSSLAGQGYLRSVVTVSIDTAPGRERKRAVVRVDPGPRSTRRRLEFNGNAQVGNDQLRAWVQAAPAVAGDAWLDATGLCRHLEAVYHDQGFLDATVRARPVDFRGAEAIRTLDIAEGRAFRVSSVRIRGAAQVPADALLSGLDVKAGDMYGAARVASALVEIGRRYQRDGFREATVEDTTEVRRADATVAVTFVVHEGPRHVLREVTVEGGTRTDPKLISRLLKLDLGQPVDVSRWSDARSRLYDTGVFRSVDIEEEPLGAAVDQPGGTEQPVRARVTLADLSPLRVRYGLQVRDDHDPASDQRVFGLGLSGDLGYKNLFRRAAAAGVSAQLTKDLRGVRGYLTFPSVGGWPVGSNLFLSRTRQEFRAESARPFVADVLDFTAEQRVRRRPALEVAYGYNFQRNHSYDLHPEPDNPLAFDLTVNVARLNVTVLHDSRDDLLDATRGTFHSSNLAYAAKRLGSDLRFVKYVLQQSYFRPLPSRLVLATSGRLGLARGFDQELIPSERFYAGGGNSVRGYADDSLGPLDLFGDPAGGNALVVLNEELRFPIASIVRGVAFFDAGSAFPRISDISVRDLRASAGIGLRVATPVGLVRVDLGVPLGRRPGEARARWFIALGQLF